MAPIMGTQRKVGKVGSGEIASHQGRAGLPLHYRGKIARLRPCPQYLVTLSPVLPPLACPHRMWDRR